MSKINENSLIKRAKFNRLPIRDGTAPNFSSFGPGRVQARLWRFELRALLRAYFKIANRVFKREQRSALLWLTFFSIFSHFQKFSQFLKLSHFLKLSCFTTRLKVNFSPDRDHTRPQKSISCLPTQSEKFEKMYQNYFQSHVNLDQIDYKFSYITTIFNHLNKPLALID